MMWKHQAVGLTVILGLVAASTALAHHAFSAEVSRNQISEDFDQLGLIQSRDGSRHSFTAPRNCHETRDGKFVAIAGASQSTFELTCKALDIPDLPKDERFLNNRLRIKNNSELDPRLQSVVRGFTLDEIMERLQASEAAAAPVNNIQQLFEDPHIAARDNLATVPDDEIGGSLRFQNVAGKLSETPGKIRHAGPPLGQHNRKILVEELGFDESELHGLPGFTAGS